jgi:hypothetical protein
MYHQNVGRYNWNIVESGAKHHKPKPPQNVGSKVNLKKVAYIVVHMLALSCLGFNKCDQTLIVPIRKSRWPSPQ